MKLVFIIFTLIITIYSQLANDCHYSCNTCAFSNSYLHCLSCSDRNMQGLNQLNNDNPLVTLLGYNNTGYCVAAVDHSANALGIVLLILMTIVLLVTRTKQAFYLFYTFQTFALFSFVEIAWLNPLTYMLQSLQYFQFFNITLYSWKQNDPIFGEKSYYRLGQFFRETAFLKSIVINGPIYLLIFLTLVAIQLFMLIRNRYFRVQKMLKEEIDNQSQKINFDEQKDLYKSYCCNFLSDENLQKVRNFLHIVFFLLLQEMVLCIYMASRFNFTHQAADIVLISIVFCIMLLYVNICIYYLPISLFPNKSAQYSNVWKKMIFPIFIIGPIEHHFVLFIFIIILTFIELCYQSKYNPQMNGCNRWSCYRVYELLLLILGLLIFYIIQTVANSQSGSQGYRVIVAILLAGGMLGPLIQFPFGVYQTFFQQKENQQLPLETMASQKRYEKNWIHKNQTKNVLQITEDSILDYEAPVVFRRDTDKNIQNQIQQVDGQYQIGSYDKSSQQSGSNSDTSKTQKIKVSMKRNQNNHEQSKQSESQSDSSSYQSSQNSVSSTKSRERKLQQQAKKQQQSNQLKTNNKPVLNNQDENDQKKLQQQQQAKKQQQNHIINNSQTNQKPVINTYHESYERKMNQLQQEKKQQESSQINNSQNNTKPVFNTYAQSYERRLQQQKQAKKQQENSQLNNSQANQKAVINTDSKELNQQNQGEKEPKKEPQKNIVEQLQQQPKRKKKRAIDNIDKELRLRYGIK